MSYKFEPCTSSSPLNDSFEKIVPTLEEACDSFNKMFGKTYGITGIYPDYGHQEIACVVSKITDDMTRHYSFMGFNVVWTVDEYVFTDKETAFMAAILSNVSFNTKNDEFNDLLESALNKLGATRSLNLCSSPFTHPFKIDKPEEFLKYSEGFLES